MERGIEEGAHMEDEPSRPDNASAIFDMDTRIVRSRIGGPVMWARRSAAFSASCYGTCPLETRGLEERHEEVVGGVFLSDSGSGADGSVPGRRVVVDEAADGAGEVLGLVEQDAGRGR